MNNFKIQERELTKKTQVLRKGGMVPGILYGPSIESKVIKASYTDLVKALDSSGEIYQVESDKGPIMAKFGEIQEDPVTHKYLHFSLVEMPKGVENEVNVPIKLKGTPVGVKKGGILVILKDEVTVSGTPRSIPETLNANVLNMDIGDKLTIGDLSLPNRVDSTEDMSEVIAICKPPVKEESSLSSGEDSLVVDSSPIEPPSSEITDKRSA